MELTGFKELLSQPRSIVVTTHHKPDGDALGSSLGWAITLKKLGHAVKVVSPSDFPEVFEWMPECRQIIHYTDHIQEVNQLIADADIICCLDFNHLKRINELGVVVGKASGVKVMIDHHLDAQGFEDFAFCDVNACSTAELIYKLIYDLGWSHLINAEIASCLYTGIVTDTGSFRFPRTTPEVHRIAASLIEAGADNVAIHSLVYDQSSLGRLRFIGHCLKERLTLVAEYKTAYFALSREELRQYDIQTGDTEGIVNYALSLGDVHLAVLIIERTDKVKLSFRSKGDFPCNELASKYFSGGGHRNASGGECTESLEATVNKFLSILPEYQQLLLT